MNDNLSNYNDYENLLDEELNKFLILKERIQYGNINKKANKNIEKNINIKMNKTKKIENPLDNELKKKFEKKNKKLIKKKPLNIIRNNKSFLKKNNQLKDYKNNTNKIIKNIKNYNKKSNNRDRERSKSIRNKYKDNNTWINLSPVKTNIKKKEITNKKNKDINSTQRANFKPEINKISRSISRTSNVSNNNFKSNKINEIFKTNKSNNIEKIKSKYLFTPKINKKSKILDKSKNNSIKRHEKLFNKSKEINIKKEKLKEEKELETLKRENELLSRKRRFKNTISNNITINNDENIHERNSFWKNRNEDKIDKIRKINEDNKVKNCTFKPKTTKLNPKILVKNENSQNKKNISGYIKKKYKFPKYNENDDKENITNDKFYYDFEDNEEDFNILKNGSLLSKSSNSNQFDVILDNLKKIRNII